MIVEVEHQERYWYPDDGGEVWVAGYQLVDASGRFLGRGEVPDGLLVTHVAGAFHRPDALASALAAPGSALTLRPEPDNPHDPSAVAVDLSDGTPWATSRASTRWTSSAGARSCCASSAARPVTRAPA